MKITDSAIQLASTHAAVEYTERQESLTAWSKGEHVSRRGRGHGHGHFRHSGARHAADEAARQAATVSLSETARQRAAEVAKPAETDGQDERDALITDLNIRVLKALFERLTGRKFRMFKAPSQSQEAAVGQQTGTGEQTAPAEQGWGVVYERREIFHESETTRFNATGMVSTADGRQIEIGIDLTMSRSFTSVLEETVRLGDAVLKDPLVLNFNGTAAQLTGQTFSFDIDADGEDDRISFVGPGSGFLALDANNDGVINDGSELFGALSGDGFAELAAHDDDGNGWIDENDSIFNQLRIWMKTESGEDRLLALVDLGVGAIYLGRIDTPFSIKDSDNGLLGQVRASGLFLFEQGGVGTMQQLDLVA